MSFKKVISWFSTDAGKNFVLFGATGAAVAAFSFHFIPNTILLDQYQDIIHLYKNGFSVPVSPVLQQRFKKAVELAEVVKEEVKLYRPFSVYGFDVFHAGSAHSRFGCIIGLPVNFSYTDPALIDKNSIKIKGESVAWDTDEGKTFLNAMVLSENAQLYAMAREIRMTQTAKVLIDSFTGSVSCFVAYFLGHAINKKYNFHAKPLNVRVVLYMLVGSFAFVNYCFMKDSIQLYYEKKVDVELKHLNPIFAEGAIEFYDKILNRNKALRKLMGSEGKDTYSVLGNEMYWLRQRHLPLVQRKAFFEDKEQSELFNLM